MTFNKKVLAGLVALAAASSAQSATLVAEDGWEVKVGGLINQFLVYTDNDNGDDITEIRDGLLPAFLNFDFKAPTMNGLTIAAHISISPGTNQSSYDTFEQREVYFTVDGSFGQILAGKALGLYGSHNILTEQTLFGVGYGTGGNGGTTLGGIGLGYDYAAWRSQFKWTSPDMNGFKIALAIVDSTDGGLLLLDGKPTGPLATGGGEDSEDLRYEIDFSYAGTMDNGSYSAWLSAMTQDHDTLADDAQAWTVGAALTVGNFEFMAQYSDSEDATNGSAASIDSTKTAAALAALGPVDGTDLSALTTSLTNFSNSVYASAADPSEKLEWSQYIIQAGYRFGGTTLVSVNYSELTDDSSSALRAERYSGDASDDTIERITVGVYHDVNANLKLVAEYTNVEDDDNNGLDQNIYSIGGFVFF